MGKKEDNLRPLNTRSKEDRRRIAKMGAEASNKKQRINKTFREAMEKILAEEKTKVGADGKKYKVNGREALMGVLMNAAAKGNIKAIEMVMNIAGEGLSTKLELTGKGGTDLFSSMTDKELDAKIKEMQNKLK